VKKNFSPWLHQLNKTRACGKLTSDIDTDVAIIGAGIAGISTAFYVLKNTDKKVVVAERFKLAHGATGHNAGQVVSYFERGFADMVREFGLSLATAGQKDIEDAWEFMDEMYTDAGLNIPFSRFLGHAGLSSFEQVMLHLENNRLRKEAGLNTEQVIIDKNASFLDKISSEYAGLYRSGTVEEIQRLLETAVSDFVAVVSYQKGCINSALFCEEILGYLNRKYTDRFSLYEHTPIQKIVLRRDSAALDGGTHTIAAKRVVLCTNGFENIHIFNETGLDIDAKYHHLVSGKIGYMSGYLEKMNKPPTAVSYFIDPSANIENSYFYLTRRAYEYEKGMEHNLISIGGPDISVEEKISYSHEDDYPEEMEEQIDKFVRKVYDTDPNKKIEYIFTWHGLMGYTKNGVRLIGPEPQNPVLLYNLGCNGVGILPSIYGGKKISLHLAGASVPKSIFDVPAKAVASAPRKESVS